MKRTGIIVVILLIGGLIYAQNRNFTRTEYINRYKELAIKEMKRTGIPASIKLAQAMLESDNGNSRLAREANNHFGIKCHKSWTGKVIYHDDDHKGECFRKYNSPEDSYRDHSDFLLGSSRYSGLFELASYDYKGWARELKRSGYATNPRYDDLLIRIIEENNLHKYDERISPGRRMITTIESDSYISGRQIQYNNRVKYIIANEGDSFESIRKDLRLLAFELYKYNELSRTDTIYPGQILYIQPKRNKAEAGNRYHIVREGESMYDISQKYAIKLDKLYKKNLMNPGEEPLAGQQLSLRKPLKKPVIQIDRDIEKTKQEKQPKERDKIEFEFYE